MCRQKELVSAGTWKEKREAESKQFFEQKQEELGPLPCLKPKDLYELGKRMAREEGTM
jgi:hypothetical protein